MHPRATQGAPTHPRGPQKAWSRSPGPEPEPEPEPESEPESAGAEDEISAESGGYAAQLQTKLFAA